MIYVNDDAPVTLKKNKLIINYNSFLKKQKSGQYAGKYIDRKLKNNKDKDGNDIYEEYKPLWIIDGQHKF